MANNVFQVKRTNVTGRTPNTTGSYATNSQYIAAGEFALNMADGILYSSNGSAIIEIGANNTNQRITNSITINNARNLNFQTVNTSAAVYFTQQNDDNFVFYSTNTAYGARPVFGVFANSITSNLQIYIPLQFNSGVVANNSLGSAGQVLTTSSTGVYWSSVAGTVTSVASGNGLTGGPITTTGTLSVVAGTGGGLVSNSTGVFVTQGTGTVVNATGVHVNATYIGTISANNASFLNSKTEGNLNVNNALTANNSTNLGGQAAAYYTNATNITTGTLPYAQIPANIINTTAAFTISGVHTYNANVVIGTAAGISANGGFGTAGQVLHSNGTSVYWAADDNSGGTVTSVATGNGMTGGAITTTGTVSVLANTGIVANSTGTFVNATYIGTISANNASFLGGVDAASYVQNTDSRTLSGNLVISGTSFTPSTNTILLGNSTQRWVLSANTGSFSGAVSGITTLAAGNTTLTGWISAQSAIITGGGSYTVGSIYSDANWGMLFRAARASPTQAQYAWKSSDDVTEYVRISPTGNVGIGNTAPEEKLHVAGAVVSSGITSLAKTNSVSLDFNTAAGSSRILSWGNSSTNGLFGIWTGNNSASTERLRIDSTGNVGIGNTTPNARLQVTGTANISGNVAIAGITTFNANVILGTSGLSSNGGFGTAGQVLTTNGTATYWDAAAGGGYYKGGSAAVGSLAVGGQNLFRVNANTLNTSTTFVSGENGTATGPITIASGITLTIQSGARVSIV